MLAGLSNSTEPNFLSTFSYVALLLFAYVDIILAKSSWLKLDIYAFCS